MYTYINKKIKFVSCILIYRKNKISSVIIQKLINIFKIQFSIIKQNKTKFTEHRKFLSCKAKFYL